jgi:thiol:disulfide interchange protein DsbD
VPFSPERLEEEVTAGRTVFVDFTAAWCLTCKANERAVIDTDEVRAVLEELGVVPMVGDWTQRDPVISRVLRRYGRSGVPFYAVFPAGRPEDPIVLPEVITRSLLVDALREAGPSRDGTGAVE